MLRLRLPLLLLLASLLWCGVGCGNKGPTRFRAQGEVTFNGKPVPYGQIIFEPDSSQGNTGPQGFADIREGKYDTTAAKGTIGGPHLVRISGFNSQSTDESNPSPPLFPEYQSKLDLPAGDTTQNFTIPASP